MKRIIAVVAACAAIATSPYAAPQKRVVRRPAAPRAAPPTPEPVYDPTLYAKSIEGVNCANLASRASSIVPAIPILKRMMSKYPYGTPPQDEFETRDAYVDRVVASYKALFGDTLVVMIQIPIKEFFKYNADRQEVTLEFQSSAPDGYLGVRAFSDLADTGSYNGQNAYGATARVTKEQFTQFFLDVKLRASKGYGGPIMKFSMAPDTARALKENGTIIVAGGFYPPFLKMDRAHSSATISDPSDTTYLKYHFNMVGSCIVVENNGQDVAHFSL